MWNNRRNQKSKKSYDAETAKKFQRWRQLNTGSMTEKWGTKEKTLGRGSVIQRKRKERGKDNTKDAE